jgi:hypothetical protein
MTAAIGFPTLRLVRWAIGDWTVEGLAPGEWRDAPMPEGFVERERAPRPEGGRRPAGGGFKKPEGSNYKGKKPFGAKSFGEDREVKRPTGGARALQDKRNSPSRLAERRAEGSRRAEKLAAGKAGAKGGFKAGGKPTGKPVGKPVGRPAGKPAGRSAGPSGVKPGPRPGADRRGAPSQPRRPNR